MGRASLRIRQTTSLGIVTAESGLTPASALLDRRQAWFRPSAHGSPGGDSGEKGRADGQG